MSVNPSRQHYIAFLTRVFGFEAPVESALAMTIGLDALVDMRGRTQLKRLRLDLAALGVTDPLAVPRCTTVFPFRRISIALGWMYVVERNTLVHGLIERHLRGRLPDELARAGTYLSAQERSAGTRWRELGDVMNRIAIDRQEADQIVYAARVAFRSQRTWYRAIPQRSATVGSLYPRPA